MSSFQFQAVSGRVWQVGALCRAIGDALEARFNPLTVRGEISGLTRAASGHSYFALKDEAGQIRCAMFRRSAQMLSVPPREGELVEVRGRLSVYGPRGDLQLVVESLSRVGQGALFEQFMQLKARLEQEGLFDPARKRTLPRMPRGIGLVTSRAAAALHDVVTALQRRVPHIPVWLAPASVQGAGAPEELIGALQTLYRMDDRENRPLDVILLVRGGGSIEDLWAFNHEGLARTLLQSPVPVICGVGHETDFTIADFVADVRAPTPTAAAELVSEPRSVWMGATALVQERLQAAAQRLLEQRAQRLDLVGGRLRRPSVLMARQRLALQTQGQRLHLAALQRLSRQRQAGATHQVRWHSLVNAALRSRRDRLERAALRLQLLDPSLVLRRGYAWLTDEQGRTIARVSQTHAGQDLQATLADGKVELTVRSRQGH